jgi:hypothetical protein
MTQTTETPDPRTTMPLEVVDGLQRRVMLSLANHSRADLRSIRSLPTWRAVTWARIAFKCRAISRRELDVINHEAEFGGVKPDKRPGPVVTDPAVEVLCGAVYADWGQRDDQAKDEARQALHGALLAAVARLDWSGVIPELDQLGEAIADPGTVVRRRKDESVPHWSARAVTAVIRAKLFA